MATLGMGIIVFMVITTEDKFTGGPDGISVVPFSIGGFVLQGEAPLVLGGRGTAARSPFGWRSI